jgi:defect-in-organelle-trafficking protein DotC
MNALKVSILIVLIVLGYDVVAQNDINIKDVISGNILKQKSEFSDARFNIIESIAGNYGIFYGRNKKIREFNNSLDKISSYLDGFNFSNLLIGENMLPPVIVEADDFYEREDATHHREVKKMYRMVRGSTVTYNIPTWRTYIYLQEDEDAPSVPSDFNLINNKEKDAWSKAVKKGIQQGVLQAQDEIDYQMAVMLRDYKGMLLAHYLNDVGIISFSKLEKFNNGIIVTDKEINIRDVLVNSTDDDKFVSKDKWEPYISLSNTKSSLGAGALELEVSK